MFPKCIVGIRNPVDKCVKLKAAGDQIDTDGDGVGNLCDNCPYVSNSNQVYHDS